MNVIEKFMATVSTVPVNFCTAEIINVNAFLNVIKACEHNRTDDEVYFIVNGGRRINDLSRHPGKIFAGGTSTAAGAYQFTKATWLELQTFIRLPDFSKRSQDAACIEKLRRAKVLNVIQEGLFSNAIAKLPKTLWTSLPGKKEQQKTLAECRIIYESFGGTYA
jgi:muramidase (phage lysozyme)